MDCLASIHNFNGTLCKVEADEYRNKLIAPFADKIKLNHVVRKVFRESGKVRLVTADGSEKIFDKVIFACHADQALNFR